MRRALGMARTAAAAAALMGAAGAASGATVAVTITGLSDTGYQLDVSGIQKNGRLEASAGPATVRDLIDVGGRDTVRAVLTFTSRQGVSITCPSVEVRLQRAQAACEPAFVLTDRQTGPDSFACEAKCQPARSTQKSRSEDEDDDDDDWVYALAAPARAPLPRLDGWAFVAATNNSQSFYNRAMFPAEEAAVYSAATPGTQGAR